MLELIDLNIIDNQPIIFQKDGNNELLFASSRYNGEIGESYTGGLAINPIFEISGIDKGWLYFIQNTTYHRFICHNSKGEEIKNIEINGSTNPIFDSRDRRFYYKRHLIDNNELKAFDKFGDRFLYFDGPFCYIEEDWSKIDYELSFTTYIAWTGTIEPIKELSELNLISSFDWSLSFQAEKDRNNEWQTILSNNTLTNDIINSLNPTPILNFDIEDFDHLFNYI